MLADTFTTLYRKLSSRPPSDPDHDDQSIQAPVDSKSAVDLANALAFPSLPSGKREGVVSKEWKARVERDIEAGNEKVTERFEIPLSLQSRNRTLGPAPTLQTALSQLSHLSLKTSTSTSPKTGTLAFIFLGLPTDIALAKRILQRELGMHVKKIIKVPRGVRSAVLGSGGKGVKEICARLSVKIGIEKGKDEDKKEEKTVEEKEAEDEEEMDCVVTGDYEGVRLACLEIELIVTQKTSKKTLRIQIPHSFHAFIRPSILDLQLTTLTRIHISAAPSNEITITGSKEACILAQTALQQLHSTLSSSTRTLVIPIAKRQHRFIADGVDEIMEQTRCWCTVPLQDDPTDLIEIRGIEAGLGQALTVVLAKSSSMHVESFNLADITSTDPTMLQKFLRRKESLKKCEEAFGVKIHVSRVEGSIEILAEKKESVTKALADLVKAITETAKDFSFGRISVKEDVMKFLVGKGGKGVDRMCGLAVFQGRVVDFICPSEYEQTQGEDVIAVVSGKCDSAYFSWLQTTVQGILEDMADSVVVRLDVDAVLCARVIGVKGVKMREMLMPFESITATFDKNEKEKGVNVLVIRGPSRDAAAFKAVLEAFITTLKTQALLDTTVTRHVDIFSEVSSETQAVVESAADSAAFKLDILKRVLRSVRMDSVKIRDKDGVISVNGESEDVEEVLTRLRDMATFEIVNSFQDSIEVKKELVARIVGKAGVRIKELRALTSCRIDINETDALSLVTLLGTLLDISIVKARILEIVDEFENVKVFECVIPSFFHRKLLVKMSAFITEFGGPSSLKVKFTRGSDIVVLTAHTSLHAQIELALYKLVDEIIAPGRTIKGYTEITFTIARSDIPAIVGKQWKSLLCLMEKYGVCVIVEDDESMGEKVVVHVVAEVGREEQMKKAKDEIMGRVSVERAVDLPLLFQELCAGVGGERVCGEYITDLAQLKHINVRITQQQAVIKCDASLIDSAAVKITRALEEDAPVVIAIHGFRGHIIGKAGKTITALRETGCTVGIYGRDSAEYVIVSGTQDERDVVCERIGEIVRMQQEIRARETEVTARVTEQQKPSEVKEISARRTVPGYSKPSVESLRPECGYLDTVEKPYVVGNGVEETRGDGWNLQGKEKVKKVKVKKSKPVEEVSVVEEKKQEIKQETISEPKPQKIRNKVIDVSPLQASPTKLQPPPPAPVQTLHTQIPTPIITKADPLPESEWTQISSKPKSARQQPAKVVQGVRSELEERAIALGMDTATSQKKKKKKVKKTVEV